PRDPAARLLADACERAPGLVDTAIDAYHLRAATAAAWDIIDAANRYIEQSSPWQLARAEHNDPVAAARLDATLALLVHACRCLADQLAPFIPGTAAKVAAQCTPLDPAGRLPGPEP